MRIDKLIKNLELLDEELAKRFKLVNICLEYPTVYVEMQSFLQCFFKKTIDGKYKEYGIECELKNAKLGLYLGSDKFISFFKTIYKNLDFDEIKRLNYIANEHKHNEVIQYNTQEVYTYFSLIYSLCSELIFKELCIKSECCCLDLFNEITSHNSVYYLESELKVLKDEISNLNQKLKSSKTDEEEKKNFFKEVEDLKKVLKIREDKISTLTNEVKELSSKNEYNENTVLGINLGPQNIFSSEFYEKAILAKRNGDYLEALRIYKKVFFANGCVYDYNLLKAIMKVALLAREFKLCKAIIYAFMHYEINSFISLTKNSNDKSLPNVLALFDQIDMGMKNNRFFANKFKEDLSERHIPLYFAVGAYSYEIARYYYLIKLSEETYIEATQDYGAFTSIIEAFLYFIQHGKPKNEDDAEQIAIIENNIMKTDLLYELMLSIMDGVKHDQLDNLAVISIYGIKELMEDL